MKKLKMTLSCILAMVMLAVSSVPAFAVNDDLDSKIFELMLYCDKCQNEYGFGETEPGDIYLEYTDTSRNNLINAVEDAENLINSYYDGLSITEEDIQSKYLSILNAEDNLCVSKTELVFLVEFCQLENNDNNYYGNLTWNDFTQALNSSISLLDNQNSSDEEIDDQYWSLLYAYNELCVSNQLAGDFDNNGEVNIIDVTKIQLALADFGTINSSQKYVSATEYSLTITIKDATNIQLYLANLKDTINSENLNYLTNNIDNKDWKINQLYCQAMYNRYFLM